MKDTEQSQPEIDSQSLHEFWMKQPVVKEDAEDVLAGYIDPTIPVTNPPDKPAPLPSGFNWSNIDVNDDTQLNELYEFLSSHYVEDSQHRFRFCLPALIIRWALSIPGAIPEWIFGVRNPKGVLVGFISGIPQTIKQGDDIQQWCAVNFLCVHSRLRNKKLAPVLIFELARRVRVSKIYRAVFSGSSVPTKPFCSAPYSHRPINLKKLSSCDFYPISKEKMPSCIKRFAVPSLVHGNCRLMTEDDIEAVTHLLNISDEKFGFSLQFTPELVRHMFMPIPDHVYSYVIPGPSGIQGFFSFYMMGWTILQENAMRITFLKAAYSWYFAGHIDVKTLIGDMVYKAANDAKADVMNALMMGDSIESLIANKFEKGNRQLDFYSYNFAVPPIEPQQTRFYFI